MHYIKTVIILCGLFWDWGDWGRWAGEGNGKGWGIFLWGLGLNIKFHNNFNINYGICVQGLEED